MEKIIEHFSLQCKSRGEWKLDMSGGAGVSTALWGVEEALWRQRWA